MNSLEKKKKALPFIYEFIGTALLTFSFGMGASSYSKNSIN